MILSRSDGRGPGRQSWGRTPTWVHETWARDCAEATRWKANTKPYVYYSVLSLSFGSCLAVKSCLHYTTWVGILAMNLLYIGLCMFVSQYATILKKHCQQYLWCLVFWQLSWILTVLHVLSKLGCSSLVYHSIVSSRSSQLSILSAYLPHIFVISFISLHRFLTNLVLAMERFGVHYPLPSWTWNAMCVQTCWI